MALLPECSLEYVNREKNQAADVLAKQASDHNSFFIFFDILPVWLIQYLYSPFTILLVSEPQNNSQGISTMLCG